MLRPSDLAHRITELIASTCDQPSVWKKEPLTLAQFDKVRLALLEYLLEVEAELVAGDDEEQRKKAAA